LVILVATASGLGAAPRRQRDPGWFLRWSDRSEQRVSYVGTKTVHTYANGGAPAREHEVRVWHAPPDKTRIEVLPPGGRIAGLVTVEVGDQRYHYRPWEKRWIALPRPYYRPPRDLLLRNYTVREAGIETIAGRRARVLHIRSRHPGNSQKNLWIDGQKGIVLKAEVLNSTGRAVSGWEFREIDFPRSVPDEMFAGPSVPQEGGEPPTLHPTSFQRLEKPGFPIVELGYLPPGYVEVRRATYRTRGREHMVIRYTDGLNMIVFIQQPADPRRQDGDAGERRDRRPPARDEQRDEPRGRRDRNSPPSDSDGMAVSQMSWRHGSLRLTLVGGVDRRLLERMAGSLTATGAASPLARGAGSR
jgi:outer membrane lipoprotein-sorting protein